MLAIIVVAAIAVASWYQFGSHMKPDNKTQGSSEEADDGVERAFSRDRLNTNTAKRSIDLSQVLGGGPGKDGIPAIDEPVFYGVSDAEGDLRDESVGMLVMVGQTSRFYPYNILNWHEVVNDTIGGKPLAITFCPLCGSAIVFDATVDGQVLTFGVSGKLFESNLLMYDRTTESLWSQARGEAVIGDLLGTVLEIYPTQVLTFAQVKEQFPDVQILSRETGHRRDYDLDPYSGYGENENTLFPVSVQDNRFFVKDLFYVVPVGEHSVALKLKDLTAGVTARVAVGSDELVVSAEKGILDARLNGAGEPLPSYVEMWFSWATHHQEDGIIWSAETP